MSDHLLDTKIEYLKGVGPKRAELLKKELSIFTFRDLLHYYPFRYIDKSKVYTIAEINSDETYIQLKGKITSLQTLGEKGTKRLVAIFQDETGSIELVWFRGLKWLSSSIILGNEYIVYGKPTKYQNRLNIPHPEMDEVDNALIENKVTLEAVYSTTELLSTRGLTSKGIHKIQKNLVAQIPKQIPETLSDEILENQKLIDKETAVINVHTPANEHILQKARFRLKFEELFYLQLKLLRQKVIKEKTVRGTIFKNVGTNFNTFYSEKLPFELTEAQKRVIREIRKDIGSGKHMNRLLQGDVGSGKTVVALLCMLIALDNGFQACLMAPTEILATQHYQNLKTLLNGMNVKIELLTGSVKIAARRLIHEQLENGELNILIGTHALIEDKVKFKNLGFVVIDEQHRFGVEQRAKLWKKGGEGIPPHVLVMTATPIPRTLAMTFYGDLDVSVIDELPPGRKAIKTIHRFDSSRLSVFGFMEEEIKKGRQIYIVYPLIKESEKLDYKDLMDGYESITRRFPLPKYRVSIVHGQMKTADKDFEMQRFVKGETQIMVATTVIEVGVDIPNASAMIIESAERFGLSQLHQLRGRVGRGAEQSFCVLMTGNKLSSDGKLRMDTMVRTNDGFEIAEVDLKLRGPGDLQGTQQSGLLNLNIADLAKDGQILQLARDTAIEILKEDPDLALAKNHRLKTNLNHLFSNKVNWSRIS